MRITFKQIGDKAIKKLIDELHYAGMKIVNESAYRAEWKGRKRHKSKGEKFFNVTGNLHDSMGWGVYFNGILVRSRWGSAVEIAKKAKLVNGHYVMGKNAIKKFLANYKPRRKLCLVVAAAMPYGVDVEEMGYTVIADMFDDLKELSNSLGLKGRFKPSVSFGTTKATI